MPLARSMEPGQAQVRRGRAWQLGVGAEQPEARWQQLPCAAPPSRVPPPCWRRPARSMAKPKLPCPMPPNVEAQSHWQYPGNSLTQPELP
mmetsp:Transcript_72535/g.234723  ORF Transcript_72535/g.234723 Transcript_72535/m.234723 type:complete len:90 (+) Transcript_72535:304-573(+)